MTKRIALGVEYQGTGYCGWQRQSHCDSVQGWVEKALTEIADHQVELHCAGRTDTGVHAVGQVVHFETANSRPLKAWVQGANTKLPYDIRIAWAKEVEDDFHARFSAVARQYRYVIFNRAVHSAVLADRVTWEPQWLDHDIMHRAAQALIGEQDFSSFRAAACQASHAMREVQQVTVSRRGDFVFIDIQANAFLHHMVRNISGTLMEIGRGEKSESWVETLLKQRDRTQAGVTAPASGLYFVNALYPDELEIPRVPVNEVLWQ
ncbi:tRNA pseudouridine(38-40) synthase TruA [Thiomicrorhabdus sp. zzn3]|uniref:tRNA pseudouridine(38-40) synthase TruA n=1 Tax=Thiomicrorhabdus sp. zzn3 TaxID=3039775 RepID=UPI0024368066|nr:tRNA pseudouridine(38-40) synthase TruA [Thiomicrorhabdus sp. zzn3]MDG6778349.1 tRNA pseudouridine(38-40) synthase TruA [Thiomicrorhabdus sp. zzn3]